MRFQKRLIASAIAMGLCATAQAFEFTNVFILGDSLSDAGQYGARFTTNPGLTAPEYLAQTDPEEAKRIWRDYPLRDYGKGWDDPEK